MIHNLPVEKQVEVEVEVEAEVEVVGVEGRSGCFGLCSSGSESCHDSDSSLRSHAAFTWTPSLVLLLPLLLLLELLLAITSSEKVEEKDSVAKMY